MDTTVYDDNAPDGRPPAQDEIVALLDGLTTADGTSYLDIFNAARDDEGPVPH